MCETRAEYPLILQALLIHSLFQASDFGICHASQLPNNTDTGMENIACCSVLPDDIQLERSTQEEYV